MQVPFYYRLGETVELEGAGILVESIIPDPDKKRVQEAMMQVQASRIKAPGAERLSLETGDFHVEGSSWQLSQIDIDNILNFSKATTPRSVASPLPRPGHSAFSKEEILQARGFLSSARDELRDLVVGEICLLQACIRRRHMRSCTDLAVYKSINRMVYHIVDAAVFASEISKAAFNSMVVDEILEDGSLRDDSDAALLIRSKIPLQQWAPSVGINWNEIIDNAQLLREQTYAKQVLHLESQRISDIVGEARRRLQLKCGWPGERKLVVKGLTCSHDQPAESRSYPQMQLKGDTRGGGMADNLAVLQGRKGEGVFQDQDMLVHMPAPPAGQRPFTSLLGGHAQLHLSEKPAIANQIRLMRNRPKFKIKRKKQKESAFGAHGPYGMPLHQHGLDVAGDRPGTFRSWSHEPYTPGRGQEAYTPGSSYIQGASLRSGYSRDAYSRIDAYSRDAYSRHGDGDVGSPPRTSIHPLSRTGTGYRSGTGTGYLPSRRGTAYSRVEYIDESDEEIDFVAEPSFSYTSIVSPRQKQVAEEEEEDSNPFTEALKQAARQAILDRIAGLLCVYIYI